MTGHLKKSNKSITNSNKSFAKSIAVPRSSVKVERIELIAPIIFPMIFPIIPPKIFSTKQSAAFRILLIIVLNILATISSNPARIL